MRLIKLVEKFSKLNIAFSLENNELLVEADEGVITDEILAEIKENKQEIISLLRKKRSSLSFAQERLWFIDQYEHNASYNMPGAVKLIGKLDINVLEKTFSEIIKRHEVLRTNIVTINNEASQLIHEESKFELQKVDQSHLPEEDADQKIQELIEIESQKPFDLANDSLIRLVLYKISDEEHTLFLNKHHIISDGWSYAVLFREISILYKAFSENKPSTLPELEIQYADYAVWQREHIEGDVLNKQSEYWRKKLSNTAILELPTDKTRPSEQTFNGANLHFSLDKDLTEKLNVFSEENDVTLFMTLLSVFKVLLNKYTGQNDICVGSPIANRTRSEIEPLIGFFVNTLALRSDLSRDIAFVDLLKQVKQTTLEAYDNQDIPFEKVVDVVQAERNLSYSPLFQVMLVLQNNPSSELSFGELNLKPIEFESRISKFDLIMNFTETAEVLVGGLEYNTDLFDKDRLERMIGHFKVLARSIISNPTVNISELEILTSAEKHKLLVEWNDTQADYPKDKCVHQLFEEQVEKAPDNIAVVFENKQLTYKELNEKSNQLAHYLQSNGLKPDSLVGICVDRSIEMIVGLLGILKAGGAYVPVDPTYPKERISYILEDADCEIVLTQEHIGLPETNSEIIYLDTDWGKIENEPTENAQSKVKSNNLAYVIYTSGSTGRPKGVMIEHANLINYLFSIYNDYDCDFSFVDKCLSITNISFDVSVAEIFLPISFGSELHILTKEDFLELNKFSTILINKRISFAYFPPTLLEEIANILVSKNQKVYLNKLYVGVEPIRGSILQKYIHLNSDIRILNAYGPTEATISCTSYKFIPGENENGIVPIGRTNFNTQSYILNSHGLILPIGIPGELHIGGDQVARGYLKRPELTAEKFFKNPFSDDTNSSLYKTGDLVKYLPDGNIEFIGRIDEQVKIRGFRIELGEIESVLNKLETIKDCIVVAKDDTDDNKQLVAYIVSTDELNVQEIRESLSKSLPNYMVPSLFVNLKKMPLTPNGKIDKKALPEPEADIETTREYVAPRNITEKKLTEIWFEVLNINRDVISINSNFFEIGGHSLKATKLVSKIHDQFNVRIPLTEIFRTPTIKQLSEYIKNDKDGFYNIKDDGLVLLKKGKHKNSNLFLIHAGSGDVDGYSEFCNNSNNGFNYWGIKTSRIENYAPINITIEDIADKYIEKIKVIQPEGPYYVAGWCIGGTIAFEMLNQLEQKEEEVKFFALINTFPPSKRSQPVNNFSVNLELNTILESKIIRDKTVKEEINNFESLDLIWPVFVNYLESEKINPEVIRRLFPQSIADATPDFENLNIKDLIYYLNTIRSYDRARNAFIPTSKSKTLVNFFSASKSEVPTRTNWNKYCYQPVKFHDVVGNHFSIFKTPEVIQFAKVFDEVIQSLI